MDMKAPLPLNIQFNSVGNLGNNLIEKRLLYLVESGGELLLIERLIAKSVLGIDHRFVPAPHKTLLFHVFQA